MNTQSQFKQKKIEKAHQETNMIYMFELMKNANFCFQICQKYISRG